MDERLTALPAPDVVAWMDALVHSWCGFPRDLCPCDPRPLPEPRRSATVRTIQRGQAAESDSEPLDAPAGPDTHEAPETPPAEPLGPVSPLFPRYYRSAS